MLNKGGHVYILTNRTRSVLYIGVTTELKWRIVEHKTKVYLRSFTAKYNVNQLVYYEFYDSIESAIDREKYLKGKKREFKEKLIESENPEWRNLSEEVMDW